MDKQDERDGISWMMGTGSLSETKPNAPFMTL